MWLIGTPKTEDPEKKHSGPISHVKEADSGTFDTIVTNSGRNSFVLFYSPACRHCMALQPIWEQLAYKLKSENLDIVRIDATVNKWPKEVFPMEHVPTIYWKSCDGITVPEKYTGQPTLRDLLMYVASKTSLQGFDRKGNPRSSKR